MNYMYKTVAVLLLLLTLLPAGYSEAYNPVVQPVIDSKLISWCTTSTEEQQKCETFSKVVKLANRTPLAEELLCKQALDKEQCMLLLEERAADITSLDPGEVFIAGRYHSLVPIMAERYGPAEDSGYYAVAVVHAESNIRNLYDLKNKSACFPGVAQLAGWVIPLVTLMEQRVMNITDCNNLVKSASNFFGNSCAPGSLMNKYNPSGDNPLKMCELCKGSKASKCSGGDLYAGFQGAFNCLAEGGGDIAFLKHDTVMEVTKQLRYTGPRPTKFSLLCTNGMLSRLDQYRTCNWGYVPAHAVVVSSAVLPERRKQLQNFLEKAATEFGKKNFSDSFYNWNYDRGQSPPYRNSSTDFYNRDRINPYDRDRSDSSNRDRSDSFNRDRSDSFNNRDLNDRSNRNQNNTNYNRELGYTPTNTPWNRTTDYRNRQNTSTYDRWGDSDRNLNRSSVNFVDRSTESPYNWNRSGRDMSYGNISDILANFNLFTSSAYGSKIDLLFLDSTSNLVPISENRQTFKGYLGDYSNLIRRQRMCPNPPARLCVVSDKEYEKCLRMRVAFKAQMLKPDLSCVKVESQISCMSLIKDNAADLAVLDAGDIYKAGQLYNLIPIIAEQYDLNEPSYYVVAVAKQPDKETDLLYLKGKKSCHTGIGTAAGWVIPMGFLLSSERMRSYGCNSVRAASEFFQKSCVPGVLSREYTYGSWGYDNLCDLCHGSSSHYCARDSHEPFYGDAGALQCIVEGGGDIAFVRHTTILENTAGKNPDWWSRPMMPDDFELLCRDGTRTRYDKYTTCNLGKVASNAIVTLRYKNQEEIDSYITLFMYAQQFYGSKYSEDFTFKMFVSDDNYHDLIFQDATQLLKTVPVEKRDYKSYLGPSFVQSVRLVDCTAAASLVQLSSFLSFTIFLSLYFYGLV